MHDMASESSDAQSDVYLFGILAFELGCGTVPFDAGSEMTLKLQKSEPVPKTLVTVGLPKWYDEFVRRCMVKDPKKRAKIADLKTFLEGKLERNAPELGVKARVPAGNDLRVLFIEDNKLDQLSFARFAKKEPVAFNYTVANCLREARIALEHAEYDVVVSDYMLPDGTGVELISEAAPSPVIIVTGAGREDVAASALREGAFDYISKDVHHEYLRSIPLAVQRAYEKHREDETQIKYNRSKELFVELLDTVSRSVTCSKEVRELAKDGVEVENQRQLENSLQELEQLCRATEVLLQENMTDLFESLEEKKESCNGDCGGCSKGKKGAGNPDALLLLKGA